MGIDEEEERWNFYNQAAFYATFALVVWGASKVFRKHTAGEFDGNSNSMQGKHVIITGANTGIGYATAVSLAKRGATLTLACRNLDRGLKAAEDIRRIAKNAEVRVEKLDLSDFSSISSFSKRINKCHVLVNNAGAMFPKQEQIDGIELTMLTNYFGPFYLTESLLPKLKQTASSDNTEVRIINVASRLEKRASFIPSNEKPAASKDEKMSSIIDASKVDLSLLTAGAKPYNQWKAYANSKICNLLYTFELSRRLEKEISNLSKEHSAAASSSTAAANAARVTVNAVTPGMVNTDLSRYLPWWQRTLSFPLRFLVLRSPEEGADTVVYAATSSELVGVSGKYLGDRKFIDASAQAQSTELATAVVAESQRIINGKAK